MAIQDEEIEEVVLAQPGQAFRETDKILVTLTKENGEFLGLTVLTDIADLRKLFGPVDLFETTAPTKADPGLINQRYWHTREIVAGSPTLADLYVYGVNGWGAPLIVGFVLGGRGGGGSTDTGITVTLSAVGTATVGVALQLSASATSAKSTIDKVEFFLGAQSIGVVSGTGPYGVSYTPTATGRFYLTAKATDILGQSKVSAERLLVVNAPGTAANLKPTITLTLTPSSVMVGQATTFSAAAEDPDGPAPSVSFFAGPTPLGTVLSAPYALGYTPTVAGPQVITAIATDNKGASTSVTKTLTVTPAASIIKPEPPSQTSDDDLNVQDFDSPYGKAALLVSIAGSSFRPYAGPYNVGNVSRPLGYYQSKVSAATGRSESEVTSSPIYTATVAAITPAKPVQTPDDENDTYSLSSPLGASEIVVSIGGADYVPYAGTINVGDVDRDPGYYKSKIKAASGRNESDVTSSPAFTKKAVANPPMFSRTLTGPREDEPTGTQLNATTGDLFKFNDKALGDGTGKVMQLTLNGSDVVASVDFLAPYLARVDGGAGGELFSFQFKGTGTVYYGRFKDIASGFVTLVTSYTI